MTATYFILRSDLDRERCLTAVNSAPINPPTEVTIKPHVKRLSREAQNRHWLVMRQASQQLTDEDGNKHSAEAWHAYLCGEFLGYETIRIGGHDRVVGRSSTTLTSAEFAEFADQCEAWVVGRGANIVFESDPM